MSVPGNLRYTAHDEWIAVDGDIVTLGITDFAQDQLGELVHIELPAVGATYAPGAAVCEVESVKAVAEVYTPVGGEIVEVNAALEGDEGQINADAYGAWLVRIKVSDASGLAGLMDAAAYEAKIG
jgi:glycine cleavage system H protein